MNSWPVDSFCQYTFHHTSRDTNYDANHNAKYISPYRLHLRCELGCEPVAEIVLQYAQHLLLCLISLMEHTPGQRKDSSSSLISFVNTA
ncbi:MAG: hypothetical protein HLUCCA11_12435 [Phormidesmis priestleyi Ana]|uniref:Uncharacterized protein n=1 Tax=Phormidesmis priestleyi Ana TaxID=1666911 RepID=A0A0N8KMX7_9CYAN|nr:MAG: hypothetical protein HLUCCA11_12435 [Phormidesmis priestleyi Ana]